MRYDFVNSILQGNASEKLKQLDSDSIDLIVTDPPYGYSFMNKDWDKAVVGVDTWKECLRVLKAGAFAFIMSSPRQDVLCKMILNLIEAGFETNFTSLYWCYASGFPKAADVSKLVDKREGAKREVIGIDQKLRNKNIGDIERGVSHFGTRNRQLAPEFYKTDQAAGFKSIDDVGLITKPATEQAKRLQGAYAGFQPKPAVEVILTVMKPLSEKTYVDQALSNGKGITWLDQCRIPYQDITKEPSYRPNYPQYNHNSKVFKGFSNDETTLEPDGREKMDDKGRFPANLLVEDDVLNDGKITKSTGGFVGGEMGGNIYGKYEKIIRSGSGGYGDSGSFSRYFSLDSWTEKTLPFLIVPKAAKTEKNKGLEGLEEKPLAHSTNMRCEICGLAILDGQSSNTCKCEIKKEIRQTAKNFHPTVKPLKLMSYLITMGSRQGDIVLDPFCGSGTVLIAARQLARDFIGIEISQEYIEIANTRLKPYLLQTRLPI